VPKELQNTTNRRGNASGSRGHVDDRLESGLAVSPFVVPNWVQADVQALIVVRLGLKGPRLGQDVEPGNKPVSSRADDLQDELMFRTNLAEGLDDGI